MVDIFGVHMFNWTSLAFILLCDLKYKLTILIYNKLKVAGKYQQFI